MSERFEVRPRRAGKNTQAVEQFNAHHRVGTPVLYWPGTREGDGRESVTRSPAWLMGGHSPVVTVDGYPGGIALTHIVVPRRAPHVPQE